MPNSSLPINSERPVLISDFELSNAANRDRGARGATAVLPLVAIPDMDVDDDQQPPKFTLQPTNALAGPSSTPELPPMYLLPPGLCQTFSMCLRN